MDPVTRLGVVGCGLMGSGIAEVAARSGIDVRVAEATPEALEADRRRLTASLDRGVRRGKLAEEQRDQALARLSFTHDLSDLADRQFVVEAVAENRDIRTDVLRTLDKAVEDPAAVPGHQHLLDPHRRSRRRHRAARAGHRHALLQPRARATAGGAHN